MTVLMSQVGPTFRLCAMVGCVMIDLEVDGEIFDIDHLMGFWDDEYNLTKKRIWCILYIVINLPILIRLYE